jgi:hypothetical protein
LPWVVTALTDDQKAAIQKVLDGSLKTEGATMKIIQYLVMSGMDETPASMGWKILAKLAGTNPDGQAFLDSLPNHGDAVQKEVGECVYDVLNKRLF